MEGRMQRPHDEERPGGHEPAHLGTQLCAVAVSGSDPHDVAPPQPLMTLTKTQTPTTTMMLMALMMMNLHIAPEEVYIHH